jgi:hypothetical protein
MSLNVVYKVELDANRLYKDKQKGLSATVFINNAVNNGWSVKKEKNRSRFQKKNKGMQKVFTENYLDESYICNNKEVPIN